MATPSLAPTRIPAIIGSATMTSDAIKTAVQELSAAIRKTLPGGFTLEAEFRALPGFTILFGPSGAGKTTLLHCLAGLTTPDKGRIALGPRVWFDSERKISLPVPARSVGYLFQNLALFPHLTVEQNVRYGIAPLPPAEQRTRTAAILESFRIAPLGRRKPGEISGGERQRVALARSLVTQPSLLLLDEPLSALDGRTKSMIIDDLRAWNALRAIPILYVTHSTTEASALGERLIVLDAGKITAQGTPSQVLDAPRQETIAQLAGFENVFDATVKSVREQQGTMRCRLKTGAGERMEDVPVELEVPLGRAEAGSPVRIAIRAGDIMVSNAPPQGLSARNILEAKLISLEQQSATIIAHAESGVKFEVHLTPGACRELGLNTGQQVWLIIKTYSCRLVEPARSSQGAL